MSEYTFLREDMTTRTFQVAVEKAGKCAQQQRKKFKIFKLVGIVEPTEAVYKPLEQEQPPEPAKPRRKALDVTLEQSGREVTATVNYVDPLLEERAQRSTYVLAAGDGYQVCLGVMLSIFPNLHDLTVGPDLDTCAKTFGTEAAAAEYVERITKLLDRINANEPQEGGEA